MYYAVINGELTAYHKSKKVVNKYVKGYAKSHPESNCLLVRDVSADSNKPKIDPDKELVSVGKILIQQKYEEVYSVFGLGDTSNISHAIDLLHKELLLEKNFIKLLQINEALKLLEQRKYEDTHYVPSCEELNELLASFAEWQYHMYYH